MKPSMTVQEQNEIIKWLDNEWEKLDNALFNEGVKNLMIKQLLTFKEYIRSLTQTEKETDAVEFLDWVNLSGYTDVTSEKLNKSAWVDSNEHSIYTHGSDFHYTELVEKYGINTEQLYTLFKSQQPKK